MLNAHHSKEDNSLKPSSSRASKKDRIQVVDADLEKYCAVAIRAGATHAKQILTSSVATEPWVRLKCQFGCPGYGKGHGCPPRTPTAEETRAILDSYRRALLFHIQVPDAPKKEKMFRKYFDALVKLEGEMFKDGYYKAFVFVAGPCRLCKTCAAREDNPCNFPWQARPSMEGCGMDVYQTARNNGLPINPLRERAETNNEYCLMLVD
jgi:predicted metal-binding protein